MTAYADLEDRFRRLATIEEAVGVLHWDMATMMPPGGAAARGEQLATLNVLAHEAITAPEVADGLAAAAAEVGDDPWRAANLREMTRRHVHAAALRAALVAALTRAEAACETAWRAAREASDFAAVAPFLEDVLGLVREAAAAKADALGRAPYDALLDAYEPDGRADEIEPIFDDLAGFLPDFIDDALARQTAEPTPVLPPGPFPVAAQQALAHRLMRALGFDFDHGRVDTSLHPFCGGIPEDQRITTRYDEADFTTGLMGVLHETGHALYEAGLPEAWRRQPVGAARGMAIHESQSLLVEMQMCRGRAFLDFATPVIRVAFDGAGDDAAWSVDNVLRLQNRVARGFIRVDADEATYPAHVILRYRLETAMIAGDLRVADLPGAWNEGMAALLGITPPDDRRGCLQDIHWYDGAWAYFPTYTLGAIAAAQFFDAACRAAPEIPGAIGRGDFTPLMAWLRTNVHGKGSLLSTRDLLIEATGRPLDPETFKAHLKARYLG